MIWLYKHVETCLEFIKPPIQIDEILQTCQDMSRLVIIQLFYTILIHVQTCIKVLKPPMRIDRILQDLSRLLNMSRLVLNHKMMKYSKIWANGRKKVDDDNKANPWTASTSKRSKRTIAPQFSVIFTPMIWIFLEG